MTKFWDKKLLMIGIEEDEGVDASLSGPLLPFLASNVQLTPIEGQQATRANDRGYMGAQPTKMYGKFSRLQFQLEMAGSGDIALAAAWYMTHRLCGLALTDISTAAGTIPAVYEKLGAAVGAFTYTRTAAYTGNTPRTVTLECTTGGGSGAAEFTVSAPAAGDQAAYGEDEELMTAGQPFDLGGGAQITITAIGTDFVVGDTFTFDLMPTRQSLQPVSGEFESATAYEYIDGVLHKFLGSRAELGWTIQNGIPYWTYNMVGSFEPVTTAANPNVDFSAWQDPLVVEKKNTPLFMLHGHTVALTSFSGNFGNDVRRRVLVNQEYTHMGGRNISGTCLFDFEGVSEVNWFDRAEKQTTGKLLFQHGRNDGEIVGIRGPNVELRTPQYRQDGNITQLELGLGFIPTDAGNDEIEIWVR